MKRFSLRAKKAGRNLKDLSKLLQSGLPDIPLKPPAEQNSISRPACYRNNPWCKLEKFLHFQVVRGIFSLRIERHRATVRRQSNAVVGLVDEDLGH